MLRNWTDGEAVALGRRWDKLVRDGKVKEEDSQDIIQRFKPLIEKVVLRFTPESNFLGTGPVVRLPPNHYAEIACQHSAYWTERLAQQKANEDQLFAERESRRKARWIALHGSDKGYPALRQDGAAFHYRSRVCASFPYLVELLYNQKQLKFTQQEWASRTSAGEWEGSDEPYLKHIHEIAESSGKLKVVGEKLEQWKDIIDGSNLPARLIFCSYFFVGARIIYLVCSLS